MNNPIEVIKAFMSRGGPKQFIEQEMMKSIVNQNPMIGNLIGMANKGNNQGIENFARNICKEKNIDFDKEFAKFMKQING